MKEVREGTSPGPEGSGRAGPRKLFTSLSPRSSWNSQQTDTKKVAHSCLWKDSGSWATGPTLSSVLPLSIATFSRPPLDSPLSRGSVPMSP